MKVFSCFFYIVQNKKNKKNDYQPLVTFDLLLLVPNQRICPMLLCGCTCGAKLHFTTFFISLPFLQMHMKCNQWPEVLLKWVMSRVTTNVIPSQLRSALLLMTMLKRISLSLAPVRTHTHTNTYTHARSDIHTGTHKCYSVSQHLKT